MQVESQTLERRFVALLAAVVHGRPAVALHEPEFAGNEWAYVKECIDTGWVSSAGTYVDEFESASPGYTGRGASSRP